MIFSYCGEFQPRQKRGMMISVVAMFWMAGNIVAAGLALAVIPSGRSHNFAFATRGKLMFDIVVGNRRHRIIDACQEWDRYSDGTAQNESGL